MSAVTYTTNDSRHYKKTIKNGITLKFISNYYVFGFATFCRLLSLLLCYKIPFGSNRIFFYLTKSFCRGSLLYQASNLKYNQNKHFQ